MPPKSLYEKTAEYRWIKDSGFRLIIVPSSSDAFAVFANSLQAKYCMTCG